MKKKHRSWLVISALAIFFIVVGSAIYLGVSRVIEVAEGKSKINETVDSMRRINSNYGLDEYLVEVFLKRYKMTLADAGISEKEYREIIQKNAEVVAFEYLKELRRGSDLPEIDLRIFLRQVTKSGKDLSYFETNEDELAKFKKQIDKPWPSKPYLPAPNTESGRKHNFKI